MHCNAKFLVGEVVAFRGILTDIIGSFISNATIKIYKITATDTKLLTSAVTERDGTFRTAWESRFLDKKESSETFKQQLLEVFTIFAKFESDDEYEPASSDKMVITVKIKDVLTYVATDKKLNMKGEIALIFVNFIEIRGKNTRYGRFIDPDRIIVTYDNQPIQVS